MPSDAHQPVPCENTSDTDWPYAVPGWESGFNSTWPQVESRTLTAEPEASRPQTLHERFKSIGYSDATITRLLNADTDPRSVSFLLEQHPFLVMFFTPHAQTPEALAGIAIQKEGLNSLDTLINSWFLFIERDFSPEQIIMIFEQPFGSQYARAVLEHYHDLIKNHGFTCRQITALATSSDHLGIINLSVLHETCIGLAAMGFSRQEMVDIILLPKGVDIARALVKQQALFLSLGLTGKTLLPLLQQNFDACCTHITRHQMVYLSNKWPAEDIVLDTLRRASVPRATKRMANRESATRPTQRARQSGATDISGEALPSSALSAEGFFQPSIKPADLPYVSEQPARTP